MGVCSSGTSTAFSTGSTITTGLAKFNGNYTYGGSAKGSYWESTMEVGSFNPNVFGLHDMHGNIWEWVEDCYKVTYLTAASDGTSTSKVGKCSPCSS